MAIGSGSEGAQTELQENYHKVSLILNPTKDTKLNFSQSLTLKEAERMAVKVLKQVMEEKLSSSNSQVAVVTPAKGFQIYSESQLQEIIDSL
jgi:20S proteasome subunit alpha 5